MSKPKKLQYNGDSKVLKYLVTCANWFLDNHTVGTLDDVILTDIADGQVLKYDSATSKFVNADESGGGGGSNVTPNPQGQPTDTLTKIGIGETTQTYYTENSQLCSTEGVYVTSNLDTTLVNGDYTLHIIDGQTEFDEDFTYAGSTVTLNLTHDYDTYDIEITSTTVGMTYCNGAWRNIYCDIYSESSGQTIYDLGTSADKVSYDNTTSGLTADDVQEAIDEVQSNVEDMIPLTQKGANGGVAELDSNGKVPSSQLPSYVDDVIEGYYNSNTDRFYKESTFITVIPPEDGKSWVDVTTNKSYRWTGSVYTRVDEGVQLGETSGTAYRGDRGKTAYDHSQLTSGNPHNVTKTDVGLGNVPNVATNDQTPTFSQASTRANIVSGEKLSVILGKIMKFFADLKTVAFSGSYNDLTDKPTIPSAQIQSDYTQTDNTKVDFIKNKPNLATVATSGSYNDLSNKPTIPTVNNATLNIKKNGTSQGTFTANASTDVNVDISVPTKTSDLTNDSGFTTNTGTVTKVSTGNGLTGGDITTSGTIKTYVPRVVADCNRFVGGQYSISWEEYTMGASYNLPNDDWYHIISIQGQDTRFGTQLALAMTNNNGTEGAYYRRMANNVWTEWYSLTIDHSKVNKAGDSMTGNLQMLGKDLMLKTVGSNSNDSGDITWYYGNGREKARFWTADTYSTALGINYRVYNESGAKLYEGTIPLQDTTYTADGVYLGLSNNKFTKRIVETGQSSQATWYKICTINITNRYGYGGVLLTIRGEGRTDGLAPYIKILCRMKQQNAMTNDPHLSLNAIEWLWFDPSNVKAFLTANTESQKTLEVWVRSAAGYQSLRTIVEDYVGAIEWVYQSGTLPDITAIETGTYGRVGGAKSLMFVGSQNNEIRFDSDTKPSTPLDIYVGYKWSNDTFDAKISGYRFCNGNGDNLVPLYCSSGSIASGDTKAVTGGAVYDKLSGISTGISGMTFQKAGKIVEIDTYGVSYSSLHSATIPNKFKPHITMGYLSIAGYIRRASDSKCQVAFLTYDYFPSDKLNVFIIDSNGEMTSPSNNDEVFITGTYFTDNLDY